MYSWKDDPETPAFLAEWEANKQIQKLAHCMGLPEGSGMSEISCEIQRLHEENNRLIKALQRINENLSRDTTLEVCEAIDSVKDIFSKED